MYAVIKTGGKQYKVTQGDVLRVEKLAAAEGESVSFDQVLLVADGDNVQVGAPILEGTAVNGNVVRHGRGDKINIVKFKRRKHHRKQMGHRQDFTEVEITGIGGTSGGAKPAGGAKKTAKPAAEPQPAADKKAETASKPAAGQSVRLDKPEGEPDDLTKLSGLGPKMAEKLHAAGIFHYWQIARISADEIAALEEELKLGGRFEREDWVGQAKELAGDQ